MKCMLLQLTLFFCLPADAQSWANIKAFLLATFQNKNVYKAKGNLVVQKVEYDGFLTTDARNFTLQPNGTIANPIVTTTTTEETNIQRKTVVVVNIPIGGTTTTETIMPHPILGGPPPPPAGTTIKTTNTTIPATSPLPTAYFIRYKVVADEGDYKYIEILPRCRFSGIAPNDTIIEVDNLLIGATGTQNPTNYIFQVSKKQLTPTTHYLASSALIGKVITIPVRVRKEYWDDNNKVLLGSLALGLGFGYKYKFGNNPFKNRYLSTILYGAGVSQQKHFFITKDVTGKGVASPQTDEIAITYLSFGVAYEVDKFNFGIFMGKDKMFGKLKNWAYQDKWWWGIGIGYELFK